MKTLVAVLVAAALLSPLAAQTTPPKTVIQLDPEPPAKNAPNAKAAPAAGTKEKEKKKEEPPPKIEGLEIKRGNGTYLGLQVVGGCFKMSFYDLKKKPVAPDYSRAALRWPVQYKVGDERTVLNQEGMFLTSGKTVRPPFVFKLYITLLKDVAKEGESEAPAGPTESYVVDFRQ